MADIHRLRLPTPFPVGAVNSYVLKGTPLTLVDPGPVWGPAREALLRGLRELGLGLKDIELVFLTHPHIDHYGLAAEVADASGAHVAAHVDAVPRLGAKLHESRAGERAALEEVLARAGVPDGFGEALYRQWAAANTLAATVKVDTVLADGDLVEGGGVAWRVVHTPGHSPGSVCFHDERGLRLLSGDHLLPHITSNAIMEFREPDGEGGASAGAAGGASVAETGRGLVGAAGGAGPMDDVAPGRNGSALVREKSLKVYIGSLRRVAGLEVREVLPGHGEPFTGHRELITQRMSSYEDRKKTIVAALVEHGPSTVFQVAMALFPHETGAMGQFLAVSEVLGHLDLLEEDGAVTRLKAGKVDLYLPATG